MEKMNTIPVTCAIIFHGEKVLAAKRSSSMDLPGKWEFPGGKIEKGENPEICLIREIKEELSIDLEIFDTLTPAQFAYSTKAILLLPFAATWTSGQLQLLEHEEVLWLGQNELFSVDWAAADVPIVHELYEKWVKLVDRIKPID
jgi:8-oxo-dGTP diphosphatase